MPTLEETLNEYFKRDRIAEGFGIEIVEFGNGNARTRMTVRDMHLNGLDIVHGAAIFALADFTFAVASNSHGTVAVAIHTDLSFVKAIKSGTLYADAKEMSLSPKISTYDILVTDDTGATVGIFHGMAYRKKDLIADIVAARQRGEQS
jgi:acyl-CoA thioesterase